MKIREFGVLLILPVLGDFGTSRYANAQVPAPVSASSIPQEADAGSRLATPQARTPVASLQNPFMPGLAPNVGRDRRRVLPSPQNASIPNRPASVLPSSQSMQGGRRGLAGLRNPYEWTAGSSTASEPTSLLGFLRQRRSENEIIVPPPSLQAPESTLSSPPGSTPDLGGSTPPTPSPNMAANPTQPGTPSMPSDANPETSPAVPSATQPGATADTGAAAPSTASTAAASAAAAAATADTGPAGPGFGGGLGASQGNMAMIGDMSPFRLNTLGTVSARAVTDAPPAPPGVPVVNPPNPPNARSSQIFYPSVRIFKISENMSPRPQDRFFFNMNSYWQVNQDINRKFDVPVKNITAYRYFFGFEKTFNDGKGSIGLRFPIDNLSGTPTAQGVRTPGSTATGNLSIFTKYILEENKKTGSLISAGFAITPQTGPTRFAGAPWITGIGSTSIQTYLGYIWNKGDFYVHGFSAFDFSVNINDVSLMYNDVGIGYYLIRSNDPDQFLTALVPTFELHVNSPLNHRDWYKPGDLAGTADVVNLTYGFNFEFKRSAILSTALITPVSSPKPFSAELAVLLNIYFGRTKANRTQITPPPIF